ncbi:MAG: type VI secretion system-associated FHA domain protein TagH [Gammaproteobacteria bacterium]|nr:type VI secretion system-associated FHA domain protein TagH [Gammaproteobacteria bacterium]
MPIEITITKSPANVTNTKSRQVFDEQGGTIGRGNDNAWVVEDPQRYISSKHVEIVWDGGQYYLNDISTNGTFYNGSTTPVGNGNRILLHSGDRFSLSDYEFMVNSISGTGSINPVSTDDPFAYPGAPFDGGGSGLAHDPFPAPLPDGMPPADAYYPDDQGEKDPLKLLGGGSDYAGGGYPPATAFNRTQQDHFDPTLEPVSFPRGIPENSGIVSADRNVIPENWYDDPAPEQKPAVKPALKPSYDPPPREQFVVRPPPRDPYAERRIQELESENQRLLRDVALLKQQLNTLQSQPSPPPLKSNRALHQHDKALIEAMGLTKWNLSEPKILEITQIAGELVLETMSGLMQVLGFRKKIKEEFRINVTTIQPVENNPLKFSANMDDAMENMFIKDNKAYQKPIEAVREGFQGIAEHQVAVLAGVQAAFKGMIDRFDPDHLERRFEKYRKAGVIKVGQKGKNWDAYKEYHKELVDNLDNSFQSLFGYDFVQAYENQLQKLHMSRKAKQREK